MLVSNKENKLLLFIKYAPVLFIFLTSIMITILMTKNIEKESIHDIETIKKLYIKSHKQLIKEKVTAVYYNILNKEKNALQNLKNNIKEKVYEAHAIATKVYQQNKDEKSKEEIIKLIKYYLNDIRFNEGRGYIFIDDINGKKILQPPNKELEGENLLNFVDTNGYKFMHTITQTIKDKSERFDKYYWYKKGNKSKTFKKIAFYKYFEPYDFAIGTGEYIDDFRNDLKKETLSFLNSLQKHKSQYIFILNYKGEIISHKYKKTVGENITRITGNSVKSIEKIITISKQKEPFIYYTFPLKNEKIKEKTSYIKSFDKWEWIIGAGYNDEELELKIIEEHKIANQFMRDRYIKIIMISLLITIFLLIISLYITKILEENFIRYKKTIRRTEEKKAKEFESLFEISNIGLAIKDKNCNFIKVNKKLAKMFGYTEEELLNQTCANITSTDEINKEKNLFKKLINKEITNYSIEQLFIKKDGSKFEAILSMASFINDKNEITYILSSIVDISDMKKKDNLLFQQSKMAAMGEMIGNIAHQWRQPLSVINTISSGIKIQIEFNQFQEETLISSMNNIQNSVNHLSNTIDDFRNFFKPDKEKSYFIIDESIDKTLKLISSKLKSKQIKIIIDTTPIKIKSFENELIQVLINIISNAIDALEDIKDSKIIFIKTSQEEENLLITIIDNAGGIPTNIINRIFEPYFTTKDKAQGTGIGLYMTEEIIVKHMNGTIKVTNTEYIYDGIQYSGAEFKITLPLKIN